MWGWLTALPQGAGILTGQLLMYLYRSDILQNPTPRNFIKVLFYFLVLTSAAQEISRFHSIYVEEGHEFENATNLTRMCRRNEGDPARNTPQMVKVCNDAKTTISSWPMVNAVKKFVNSWISFFSIKEDVKLFELTMSRAAVLAGLVWVTTLYFQPTVIKMKSALNKKRDPKDLIEALTH